MDLGLSLDLDKRSKAVAIPFSIATDVPNKGIWLDASNPAGYTITPDGGTNRVSPILDLSGTGKNASQGTLGSRVITGTRTAKGLNTFDYIAASMANYSFANDSAFRAIMLSSTYSFFFAVKPDTGGYQRILVGSNGATPDWGVTFTDNYVGFGAGSKGVEVNSTGIMNTNNMNIIGVRRNGNRLDLWVNGVQYTNNTPDAITLSLTHGPFLFHEFNAINEFDGQFGELLGTTNAPSDALVLNIINSLASKWRT